MRTGGTRDDVLRRLAALAGYCVAWHAAYRLEETPWELSDYPRSHLRPVREAGADRRGIHRHVVHDRRRLAVGDGGGGDPVARLARPALRPTGAGHPRGAAAARADVLAAVAGGNLVAVEEARHPARVARRHQSQDLAVERLVEIRVGRARRVPEAAGADHGHAQVARMRVDALAHRAAELVAAQRRRLRRVVAVQEDRHERRREVGERLRGPEERVADAALGLRHLHAERGIEAAPHQPRQQRDGELRMPAHLRALPRGQRALERLADVDRERREVGEVEAFQLVVAEDHERVRPRRGEPVAQRGEGRLHPRLLLPVRVQVVHGAVGAQRAARADLVPFLRRAVARGAVSDVEDADQAVHAQAELRSAQMRCISSAISGGWPTWKIIGRGWPGGGTSAPRPVRTRGSASATFFAGSRTTALGSPPLATTAASSSMRRRSRITPRSLSPRCSLVRSAIVPWPSQAVKSWFMMWLVNRRPVAGSVIGPRQYGMRGCANGAAPGTGSLNHATCSVRSSSIGTRHSNLPV